MHAESGLRARGSAGTSGALMLTVPRPHSILLVEARSTARDALVTLLADEGYVISTAETGEDAVTEACVRLPAVVIADLDAPGIGAAVARLVALPHPPEVIAVTEFGRIAPALAALRDGATDYIIKPIRADELSCVLAKAIEHHELTCEVEQLRSELGAARSLQ
jgi:DNA-binding NtrC family response regulator